MINKKSPLKYLIMCLLVTGILFQISVNAEETPLKIYDAGEKVKFLQEELIKQGYLNDVADGLYGPKTQTAVESYQKANSLAVSGIADEATMKQLFPDGIPSTKESVSDLSSVGIVPGYTPLQSLYLSITPEMSENQVIALGQKYNMYVYNSDPDSEFAFRYVYISDARCTRYERWTDEYIFEGYDSLEVIFDKISGFKLWKSYYHFGDDANGYLYSVECGVTGNSVKPVYYNVVHGYISADPTANYYSLQDALDAALDLYQ